MKLCVYFLLSALLICTASALIEKCSKVSDCSTELKKSCDKTADYAKETNSIYTFVVQCRNGICMCNLSFADTVSKQEEEKKDNEKERDDEKGDQGAEEVADEG